MHGLRQRGVGMPAAPCSLPHRRYVYSTSCGQQRAFELRATFEVTALAATTRTPLTYPASPQGLLGVSARTSSSRTPWTSSSVQVSVPSTTSCQQYQPSCASGHKKMVTVTSPNLYRLPVHRLRRPLWRYRSPFLSNERKTMCCQCRPQPFPRH